MLLPTSLIALLIAVEARDEGDRENAPSTRDTPQVPSLPVRLFEGSKLR